MGQIIVNLDVEMAKRKMSLSELAERVGLTLANLSILKTGKAKAVRFTTLEAICRELGCQPGDILDICIYRGFKFAGGTGTAFEVGYATAHAL